MTIEEAKGERIALQREITALLAKFERETKLTVQGVVVHSLETISGTHVREVDIEVSL